MTVERDDILDGLRNTVTRGIKLTALADDIGVRKADYARLRQLLAELAAEGAIQIMPGGAFALAPHGRAADKKAKAGLPWKAEKGEKAEKPERAEKKDDKAEAPTRPMRTRRLAERARREPEPDAEAEDAPAPAREREPARGRDREPVRRDPRDAREPIDEPPVSGRITVHPAGYGFVALPDGRDAFVPAKYRGGSLDGDQVKITTWVGVKGTEGRVVEVLARGRARLTGILRKSGFGTILEPDDPRIAADFGQVELEGASASATGQAVLVEITRYPTSTGGDLAARVIKVLGDPDDPRTEILKILEVAGMPLEFPPPAVAQAEATPQEVRPIDLADRIDLRGRRFATIDPETARDFDDALCIEDGPHGTRVWVAVADVSHYVRWDDALDRESTLRGVSVYLPDRVISMLPLQLSSGICSLNPDVDRCAMVVRLDYDRDAKLVDTGYAAAVIRSQARLDYPGVAAALRGDFRGRREAYRRWLPELERLNALAQQLRAQRKARGTLDLDLPEAKVILDADDPRLVRDVVRSKGDPDVKGAYQLVEEFMIAANEAVGRYFKLRNLPTVWRVHAPPKRTRVEELAEILGGLGIDVDVDHAMTPLGMKQVLDQVAETSAARSLSFLVLRSLKQAVWDTVPIGHFGLASGEYVHFTSPIRRYPDLIVHRLLKHHLHRDGLPSGGAYREPPPTVERLTELAANASAQERRAMEAEREAVAMYRAYLMRDQIGQRFTGTVSAVTSFGAFVEIDQPFVEGLIRIETLGTDVGYDEAHLRLRARRSGFTLAMGDAVEVELVDVSVPRRRLDLRLANAPLQDEVRDDADTPTQRRRRERERERDRDQHRELRGKRVTAPLPVGRDEPPPRRRERPERPTAPPAAPAAREELRHSPRAGLAQQKRTGKAVAAANPRAKTAAGGKKLTASGRPMLGVSHHRPAAKKKER